MLGLLEWKGVPKTPSEILLLPFRRCFCEISTYFYLVSKLFKICHLVHWYWGKLWHVRLQVLSRILYKNISQKWTNVHDNLSRRFELKYTNATEICINFIKKDQKLNPLNTVSLNRFHFLDFNLNLKFNKEFQLQWSIMDLELHNHADFCRGHRHRSTFISIREF